MSDIIKLLPDSVANQIAAGEVIQRPASVIKELVENAVDAKATEISIVIRDAGKTMIQVIDNGIGMSETDARMAFERHATSKIRQADDLFALHTMGFRGEALPSICAISEVDLRTRTADRPMGTHLVIEGSKVMSQEPCMCERGTVFTVKRLFFNVPARRKFLKSDNVELTNIMREFERLALVNNNIRMRIDTGNRQLDLRAASLKQRIADLWKNSLNMNLLPIEVETSLVKIEGFISRPEFARRHNALQFFFVNGRHMRHPYFHKAVLSCYEPLIASDTQPNYFLKFTVDPNSIDVNIHPTKNEIKFEYEQQIWPILTAAVKAALGKFSAVPSIDFNSDALPVNPVRDGETPAEPKLDVGDNYNPFTSGKNLNRVDHDWETLYSNFKREATVTSTDSQPNTIQPSDEFDGRSISDSKDGNSLFADDLNAVEISPICLQYADKYIVTSTREGILVIDQHRAHVKVLYEEYMKKSSALTIVSQNIMFPESVSLEETQYTALAEIEQDLENMGFKLDYEAENRWQIVSVPSMLRNADYKSIILRILDSVTEDSANYGKESREMAAKMPTRGRIALVMARAAAIRRGQQLTAKEMEHLIGELFSLPDPGLTPTGNRVFVVIEADRLEKLF